MALQHMDFPSGSPGIWGGSTTNMENGVYANVATSGANSGVGFINDPDPNVTGSVLSVSRGSQNGYGERVRYVLSTTQSVVGMACRVWLPNLPTQNTAVPTIFGFNDISNNRLVNLIPLSTGALRVSYDINETAESFTTPGPVVVAGTWHHIEMKCDIPNGSIEVRVDGVPVIILTGQDIADENFAQVVFGATNVGTELQSPSSVYYKDFVIWDGSGTENTDFLGSVQVYLLSPDSDVSFNWTPSTGSTGWNLIDEAPADDADYISADDTPPAASSFGVTNLPEDVTSIRGLKSFVRALKTDGGDGQLQVSVISNGTTGNGTDRPVTTVATYWSDIWEVDPDTSSSWTRSAVNQVNLQVDRTL